MASCTINWTTACSNTILSSTALYSSYRLFKDHRAPSAGLFLLGISAGFCCLHLSNPHLTALRNEVEWASEVLAPALVSFDFLWLSEDRSTAHILLCGSCLFLGLCDRLSADAIVLMTRCLTLSSLSCCLTVCLFAGNALGALGSVALSLPSLVAPRVEVDALGPLISSAAAEGVLKWLLKGSMSVGCWASTCALRKFQSEVNTWTD
ncbi:transmembrane protein 276-like [Lampris incognitus]|uniref:transmembrane protein 276-like n=1 Tax=Lampris incognitus TaxID=2546036 RepID=UPI0024B59A4A|nr:transmembrane protein 276-like [Lampris incognitus]